MVKRSLSIFFWAIFFFFLMGAVTLVSSFLTQRQKPVSIDLETVELNGPRQALVVKFSQSVRESSLTEKDITLVPTLIHHIEWHNVGQELVILPDENWKLDETYTLSLGPGKTTWWKTISAASFRVTAPKLPHVVSVTPADGMTGVVLGIEDPIRVVFDKSLREFYADFSFSPVIDTVVQNNPEKTVFEILPKGDFKEGQKYDLSITLRWRNEKEDAARPLLLTHFTTLPPKPKTVANTFTTRLTEAKRSTKPQITSGKYIDINLSTQVMTLFEDGQPLDSYVVSSGKRGLETPKGTFSIHNKTPRPWSKLYGLYMPYWQAITTDGKVGIHELPEWPGGYKEGANHLGIPVSHGCVRLGIGPAKRVYDWTEIGTPIVIY